MVNRKTHLLAVSIIVLNLLIFPARSSNHEIAQSDTETTVGTITGTVLRNVVNRSGIDIALAADSTARIKLIKADGQTITTSPSVEGRYVFESLESGNYSVRLTADTGQNATAEVDVAPGLTSTLNFLIVPRKPPGVFPSYAAMAIDASSDQNPDVDGNGIVDLDDLRAVQENVGNPHARAALDVNRDQRINEKDIQLVRAAFMRAVILVPGTYQADVSPGGAIARIQGLTHVKSENGHTVGVLSRTVKSQILRLTVQEDRGLVTSPILGDLSFMENADDPAFIDVNLNTGRVHEGRYTVTLTGGPFDSPVDVLATIPDGMVTIAPHGFELFHLVNMRGTFPETAPIVGGLSFVLSHSDRRKPNVACAKRGALNTDGCLDSLGRTHKCIRDSDVLSFACSSPGATCAQGGQCGTCQTTCSRGLDGWWCDCDCR